MSSLKITFCPSTQVNISLRLSKGSHVLGDEVHKKVLFFVLTFAIQLHRMAFHSCPIHMVGALRWYGDIPRLLQEESL